MNRCLIQFSARKLSEVKGSRPQHWLQRFLNSTVAFMAGMLVLGLVGVSCAADPATNTVSGRPAVSEPPDASAPASTNGFNVLDDNYRLAIGDQLTFQIIEDEDDPVHLAVTDSGEVQVPYIGRYPVTGKTCKELARDLKVELEKKYYRQATVIIAVDAKPKSRGKIYLVGAIGSPGSQEIASDEVLTVSRAILRAGGLSGFADGKNVKITRGTGTGPDGKKTFVVNVVQIYENGKTEKDLQLQPGDLIYVPEKMIRF